MRPELILDPELRRDIQLSRPGRRARRPRKKATLEQVALRARPMPAEFVTSPDQGGRRRLLARFGVINRLRRAS